MSPSSADTKPLIMTPQQALQQYFGFSGFLDGQEEVISGNNRPSCQSFRKSLAVSMRPHSQYAIARLKSDAVSVNTPMRIRRFGAVSPDSGPGFREDCSEGELAGR